MAKNRFTGINTILPGVVDNLGLDRRMQEQALFSLWSSLIDPIYASRSAPLYIDNKGILVVAAENGSTAQELSFLKTKLLAKLRPIGLGLGLTIKGMRFDLKRFLQSPSSEPSAKTFPNEPDTKITPTDDELAAVILSEDELAEIATLKKKLLTVDGEPDFVNRADNLPSNLVERIAYIVEKKMRIKKWCLKNDTPVCIQCQDPLPESCRTLNIVLCLYCSRIGLDK